MILTRQVIFIISIVFLFVNRATSGNICSSTTLYENSLGGSSSECAEEEEEIEMVNSINASAINSTHLSYCKLELTTPFQKKKPFDNFLNAFLYLNSADFLVTKTYTHAAYEYFLDLLDTAQDLNQPALENPQAYCRHHYRDKVEICLRGIEKIGCNRNDVGVICVRKLYLDWKKDESNINSVPHFGTEGLSDEILASAISRGSNKYPDLSQEGLLSRLTDSQLLEDFYNEKEDQRRQINFLRDRRDKYARILNEAYAENRRNPSSITRFNISIANQNYDNFDRQYKDQYRNDLRDARHMCFGFNGAPYSTLLDEYKRRQNLCRQFGNSYAMYLYNQSQLFGQNMDLDSEEMKIFKGPEDFCKTFLLNNPDYYNYLYG